MTDLYNHPKVIMTAHIGGFTEESVFRSTDAAVENILEVLTIHNSHKSNLDYEQKRYPGWAYE